MKIAPDLLDVLCCPETHQSVAEASPALLEKLNQQIAAGAVRNRGGQAVKERLPDGLVRKDGKFLYPVLQDIPIMLANEAIPLD